MKNIIMRIAFVQTAELLNSFVQSLQDAGIEKGKETTEKQIEDLLFGKFKEKQEEIAECKKMCLEATGDESDGLDKEARDIIRERIEGLASSSFGIKQKVKSCYGNMMSMVQNSDNEGERSKILALFFPVLADYIEQMLVEEAENA